MQKKTVLTEIALGLLDSFEAVLLENEALKALLSNSTHADVVDQWKDALHEILGDPSHAASLHATLSELRDAILRAKDDETILQQLRKLPPKGSVN